MSQTEMIKLHIGGKKPSPEWKIVDVMYLEMAGFESYERVTEFNLFQDCSLIKLADTYISLNMIAAKL